jgi:TPR repeat protein
MDISDAKGGLCTHLLSHDPDAALCSGESSLHMASAPSDSVVRTSDNVATPTSTAPPGSLYPKLTTAVMLMRQGNYRDAIPLLEQAAADGSAEADVELAECFGQGWGTPHNPARALEHASRSASRGSVEGRYMVAW